MNLDILIRIREQLTGLNRAQQGLRDLNAQVAGSSKQWTQMAAGALGVTAAVGLLGAEIRHVVANIAEIPGVPPETVTSIQMMKDNFAAARAQLDQWLAKGAEWFSKIGQGIGYLAGAAVYGWDAASDAYGEAEKEAEAALAAAKDAKNASKALEDQHRAEEESSRRLASALDGLAKAREASDNLGESTGRRINRLTAEAAALRGQAAAVKTSDKDPKDKQDAAAAQKAELTARALQKETEARQLNIQLNEQLVELGERQREAAREQLSLSEQLKQAEERAEELRRRSANLDMRDAEAAETSLAIENERLDVGARIRALKQQIAEKDKESAQHALEARQAAIQEMLLRNTQARGRLDSDYTQTEAEKWVERKRLIEDAISAQKRYIDGLQQIAGDMSQPAAVRADANREITVGNRDLGSMQNEIAGLGPDPFSTIEQLQASLTGLRDSWGTTSQQIAEGITGVIGGAVDSLSRSLTGVLLRAKDTREAFIGVGEAILENVVGSVVQFGVRWVANQLMMATMGRVIQAGALAATAPIALAATAMWAAPATLATIATGGAAAAAAPGFITAANVTTLAGSLAAFATGGPVSGPGTGTSDSILARLSNGEYVMPADVVRSYGQGFFDSIRDGSFLPALATGGMIGRGYSMPATVVAPAAQYGGGGERQIHNLFLVDRRRTANDIARGSQAENVIKDVAHEDRYNTWRRRR